MLSSDDQQLYWLHSLYYYHVPLLESSISIGPMFIVMLCSFSSSSHCVLMVQTMSDPETSGGGRRQAAVSSWMAMASGEILDANDVTKRGM